MLHVFLILRFLHAVRALVFTKNEGFYSRNVLATRDNLSDLKCSSRKMVATILNDALVLDCLNGFMQIEYPLYI